MIESLPGHDRWLVHPDAQEHHDYCLFWYDEDACICDDFDEKAEAEAIEAQVDRRMEEKYERVSRD